MPPVKGLVVFYAVLLGLSVFGIYQYMPVANAAFAATFTDYGIDEYHELCTNTSSINYCGKVCEKDGKPFDYQSYADSQESVGFARFTLHVIVNIVGNAIGLLGAQTRSIPIITVAVGFSLIQPLNAVIFFGIGMSNTDSVQALQIYLLSRCTNNGECDGDAECTADWLDEVEAYVTFLGVGFGIAAVIVTCVLSGFAVYNAWIAIKDLKNPGEAMSGEVAMATSQNGMPVAHAVPMNQAVPVAQAMEIQPVAQVVPIQTPAVDGKSRGPEV